MTRLAVAVVVAFVLGAAAMFAVVAVTGSAVVFVKVGERAQAKPSCRGWSDQCGGLDDYGNLR